MPYHIDEENSELAFEVREGNKLVIKIKSNIFSDSLELYLIKVGDNTEPTDKNVFSSLRVLKEIENLHDTILKEINSVTSGFWELKQDSQGNEYISTKYNVLTEGGLTTYGLGEQKLGTIYDGLPIDNNTIYWEEVDGSRVLKAKGSGGEAGSVQWGNISGKPTWIEDTKPTYNWYEIQGEKPFYTKEEVAAKFVTIDTEQDITALKHFTAGLSVGESKKKIYEENGVVYIDADVAVTGAMTFYATAGRTVSTIMDAVTVDGITIKKENNVLKAVSGAGSSFDENAMWSALSGSSDNQINKSHLTTALDGYATQNWVIENYATKSELSAVSNKLNDFLDGSDTDTIINKWKELEAFLSGMAETDNLAEILETKADKKYVDSTFVTLATKQTITGEKTFSSVLNTAAIKASGEITTPSLAASDYVTIAGIKLRKLEDGALMLEGNLALTGALTMYASNGQSFDTIYDGLPIDNDTIYWQEVDGSRVLKAREGSGSSFDKSAMWNALAGETTEQINKSHLTTALTGYATESWVSGKNYAVKATTLAGYGITDGINAVSVTGTGNAVTAASISGHTLTLTKGATFNNYTHPTATATTITAANGKVLSAITVNNQGHVTSVSGKTLAAADIPTLEISKISGLQDSLDAKLESSAYTAADVLAKLKTVDGAGSDLEADILALTGETGSLTGTNMPAHAGMQVFQYYQSGNGPTYYGNFLRIRGNGGGCGELFLGWATSDNTGNIWYKSKRDVGLWGSWRQVAFTDMNVASATRLQTARTLWGQNFNGEQNVSGSLSNVLDIDVSGTVRIYGSNPLFFPSYGGGWYMSDSGAIRCYGDKAISTNNSIYGTTFDASYALIVRGQESCDIFSMRENNGNLPNIYNDGLTGIRHGLLFQWYDTYWGIGNVRDGSVGSRGFAVYRDRTAAILINIGQTTIYGNLLATGGCTFYGSDIRYKSIIQSVPLLSLNKIAKAPSFIYRWNKHGMNQNRLNLGGSAQYTQTILPWAVEDNDNFLSMDYATVAYTFAVHTARHLLTYETRTDKKIKKLEREIVILKKQLKKLGYEEVRTLDDQSV